MKDLADALRSLQAVSDRFNTEVFVLALFASLLASLLASALYRFFYENRGTGSQVHRAFPLLGISITSLFVCIQLSLPLSLGLLGALSIVRFRTPIKEPEEVGFIMLVIASSVACATLNFHYLVLMNAVAIVALLLTRRARAWKHFTGDGIIVLSSVNPEATEHLEEVISYIDKHTRRSVLESSSIKDGVTSLQFSFTGLKTGVPDFQAGIRALGQFSGINIFFNRPGGLR
jgi:hypothetical protein